MSSYRVLIGRELKLDKDNYFETNVVGFNHLSYSQEKSEKVLDGDFNPGWEF